MDELKLKKELDWIKTNMAFSDMDVSNETLKLCEYVLRGEITGKEAIDSVKERHQNMKTVEYPAVFTFEEDDSVSVTFPDLPGCFSFGNDINHARNMAKEALGLHLKDFSHFPEPSYLSAISGQLDFNETGEMVKVDIYPPYNAIQSLLKKKVIAKAGELTNILEEITKIIGKGEFESYAWLYNDAYPFKSHIGRIAEFTEYWFNNLKEEEI